MAGWRSVAVTPPRGRLGGGDCGTIDSPVASLSTIRAMVFLMGRPGDIHVLSSIDVSTAFLQSESYDPNDAPRYVSYQPCKSVTYPVLPVTGPIIWAEVGFHAMVPHSEEVADI